MGGGGGPVADRGTETCIAEGHRKDRQGSLGKGILYSFPA